MGRQFPRDSLDTYGPDGSNRSKRGTHDSRFTEPTSRRSGREQAYIDEEGAWLNALFLEPDDRRD